MGFGGLGCQKASARKIVDQGGEDALVVKENQEQLAEDIQGLFERALDRDFAGFDPDTYEKRELRRKGGGIDLGSVPMRSLNRLGQGWSERGSSGLDQAHFRKSGVSCMSSSRGCVSRLTSRRWAVRVRARSSPRVIES
jgi:hypothetical protein